MAIPAFRLESVTLEGFKGFASAQTIDFARKHLFLFGANGRGKSSLVEAIRWCLFGDRSEEEVRNAFYTGDSRVELRLAGPGGTWSVRRRLRSGAGRSDQEILDPTGKTVLQTQVFPNITKIGPKEGPHIIFSAQQASGRHWDTDISDFDKILYSYLRLENVPDLLLSLERIITEQEEAERKIAARSSELEAELRRKLDLVQSRIDEIVRHPPWGEASIPTAAATDEKIQQFIAGLAGVVEQSVPAGKKSEELLQLGRTWTEHLTRSAQSKLQQALNLSQKQISELSREWSQVRLIQSRIIELAKEAESVSANLATLLGSGNLQELGERVSAVESELKVANARLILLRAAHEYCGPKDTVCPVCDAAHGIGEIQNRIHEQLELETQKQPGLAATFEELGNKLINATVLQEKLDLVNEELIRSTKENGSKEVGLRSLLDLAKDTPVTKSLVDARLQALNSSGSAIQEQLRSGQVQHSQWSAQLKNFETELRFHEHRATQSNIEGKLRSGLERIQERHAEMLEILDSLKAIRDAVNTAFNDALDRTFPYLNAQMTEVYRRLTQQPSFENVGVRRLSSVGPGRKLALVVSSERAKESEHRPEDVLNGQALNALRLVPYFVFSEFQEEAVELDFLLIDDPSQSFDTGKVQLLLAELAKAASHAQLVIASHEADKFEHEIPKHFAANEYRIIEIIDFDPTKGPHIALRE